MTDREDARPLALLVARARTQAERSDYGAGFGWAAFACLKCGVILGPMSEEDAADEGMFLPEYVNRRCDARLWLYWLQRRLSTLDATPMLPAAAVGS